MRGRKTRDPSAPTTRTEASRFDVAPAWSSSTRCVVDLIALDLHNARVAAGLVVRVVVYRVYMTSKPSLTPTPAGPKLVKRVVPVIAAAAFVTGCPGPVGGVDADFQPSDAGISVDAGPPPAFDGGVSLDAPFPVPEDDAAITDDVGSDDAGPVSADDAD